MLSVKPAAAAGLVAVVLAGCASTAKPVQGRGKIDDPRTHNPDRMACLRQKGLSAQEVGLTGIQVGSLPAGPTIEFTPTPGAAQSLQIEGRVPGAEIVGSALVYPHGAGNRELTGIEDCLTKGVSG